MKTESEQIQDLMWALVGLERDAEGLRGSARHARRAGPSTATRVADLEDRNLLELARIVAAAALAREESRGAHDRTDFPETDPEWAYSLGWRIPALELVP